jgi:hypothetical protein
MATWHFVSPVKAAWQHYAHESLQRRGPLRMVTQLSAESSSPRSDYGTTTRRVEQPLVCGRSRWRPSRFSQDLALGRERDVGVPRRPGSLPHVMIGADMDTGTAIRAPRGSALTCKGWHQEAALRMLHNNLDPEVAEKPDQLIVYGGTGRAARSWEAFHAIVRALRVAGKRRNAAGAIGPAGGHFPHHAGGAARADRQLEPGGPLVELGRIHRLERLGLTMYGQMTAGSWIYIGSQGIVQGTFETFAALARRHFGGSLGQAGGLGRHGRDGRRAAAGRGDERRVLPGHRCRPAPHRAPPVDTGLLRPDGTRVSMKRWGRFCARRKRAGSDFGRAGWQLRRRAAGTGAARHRSRRAHRPDQRARSAERLRAARHDARRGGCAALPPIRPNT